MVHHLEEYHMNQDRTGINVLKPNAMDEGMDSRCLKH
jgi:hypothetical protein